MRVARGKKRRSGRRKIPLAATAGLIGAVLPMVGLAIGGDFEGAGKALVAGFTTPAGLKTTVMPILIGAGVSMMASKIGINRYLSGIPLVKL